MTKTRNAFKITVALTLVALTAFLLAAAPACSCGNYRRETFDYNAIMFTEVDASRLDDDIAYARSKIDGNNMTALNGALNRVVETLNAIGYNYQYAYIEYLKDTRGDYKEIYTRYDAMYTEAYKKYMDLMYDVLQKYPDSFDDEFKQQIEDSHATMDEEYVRLQNEITALETAYNELTTQDGFEKFADDAAAILVQLVAKYNALAGKSGGGELNAENYIEVAYAQYGRAYDADKAQALCDYVKEYIGPLLDDARAGVDAAGDKLNDRAAEIQLTFAAKGEDETARNYGQIEAHAKEIGGYMSEALSYLGECNLHYKATAAKDPHAVDGALTTFLNRYNAPYIYQYCKGGYGDMMTFVHEFGHFTAFYQNGGDASYDLDIAEIHSQANEMLFLPRLDDIYGGRVGEYLTKSELFDSLYWSVTMGCLLDEFQRALYSEPETYANTDAINGLFESLMIEYNADGYGDIIGESAGYDFNRYWWAAVSHTFTSPFYYISYAVSALPALTIYEDSQEVGRRTAVEEYNAIQANGNGTYTFEELLTEAKVASPFDRQTVRNLANFLKDRFAA